METPSEPEENRHQLVYRQDHENNVLNEDAACSMVHTTVISCINFFGLNF